MKFNLAEIVAAGAVALAGLIQFLRCRRDFSQVFYETVFLAASLIGAMRIAEPLQRNSNFPAFLCFLAPFVVFSMGAVILATFLNRVLEFDPGRASWLFGLMLAIVCGVLAGHAVLRIVVDIYGPRRPEFGEAIARSWFANQLYSCPALRNLLAQLKPTGTD